MPAGQQPAIPPLFLNSLGTGSFGQKIGSVRTGPCIVSQFLDAYLWTFPIPSFLTPQKLARFYQPTAQTNRPMR